MPDWNMDNGFVFGASSNHPGGVNVLFADGGVRFVKDGIDRMVWWSLGTKAGGEVVSADSLLRTRLRVGRMVGSCPGTS